MVSLHEDEEQESIIEVIRWLGKELWFQWNLI